VSQSAAEKLLAEIAARFHARVEGGKFRALCPAHPDKTPSLRGSLGCGNGEHRNCACRKDRVVLHCFAQCRTETVLETKGLTFADLFVNRVPHRSSSALGAARVFKPDRRQWKLDVLASKLPAPARDILADPDVQRLFPGARSAESRARSIRRLAQALGVGTSKRGMREGWFWALERAQNIEGDRIAPENPARAQEIAEGDNLSGRKTVEDGQNGPFAPSRISWTFREGDSASCVRYEERSPSVGSTLEMERDGVAARTGRGMGSDPP